MPAHSGGRFDKLDLTAKDVKTIPMRTPEVFEDVTPTAK